jgi:hypothetical protein
MPRSAGTVKGAEAFRFAKGRKRFAYEKGPGFPGPFVFGPSPGLAADLSRKRER